MKNDRTRRTGQAISPQTKQEEEEEAADIGMGFTDVWDLDQ